MCPVRRLPAHPDDRRNLWSGEPGSPPAQPPGETPKTGPSPGGSSVASSSPSSRASLLTRRDGHAYPPWSAALRGLRPVGTLNGSRGTTDSVRSVARTIPCGVRPVAPSPTEPPAAHRPAAAVPPRPRHERPGRERAGPPIPPRLSPTIQPPSFLDFPNTIHSTREGGGRQRPG